MQRRYLLLYNVVSLCLFFSACQPESSTTNGGSTVVIRLPNEPDMLNPARSQSAYATQIEEQIFLPLAEIDPYDYTLTPLLIDHTPVQEPITQGPDSGGILYHYRIRDGATWEDGTPVTGDDYAFTIKMVLDPKVDVAQWRGFLSFITDVQIDPKDRRSFTVTVGEPYVLSDLVTCNLNIYEKAVYDPQRHLDDFSVRALSTAAVADSLAQHDPRLQQFAETFMQSRFANEVVTGSGAYRLASWETGQRIILERKNDWWGDHVQDKPTLLNAYPEKLIYEIVPDENTALTMLKDGTLDVMSEVSPRSFLELKADSAYTDKLQFFTVKLQVCNYLCLNNRNPILSDIRVRKALAHAVDYEGLIQNVALGMAERTIGPVHPDLDYYNKDIAPVRYDLDQARALLASAGWSDTNGNGIVDKVIGGQRTELTLDMTVTQKPEGQAVALLLKESAARAGIDINIVTRDGAAFSQDVRARNFDIVPLRMSSPITLNDPYQDWSSSSDVPGGGNRSGFHNATADSLITVIRRTSDAVARTSAFKELQAVIAEEQPVIFLYVPLERIIASKRFKIRPSARRPGYFEQLFLPAEG